MERAGAGRQDHQRSRDEKSCEQAASKTLQRVPSSCCARWRAGKVTGKGGRWMSALHRKADIYPGPLQATASSPVARLHLVPDEPLDRGLGALGEGDARDLEDPVGGRDKPGECASA